MAKICHSSGLVRECLILLAPDFLPAWDLVMGCLPTNIVTSVEEKSKVIVGSTVLRELLKPDVGCISPQ